MLLVAFYRAAALPLLHAAGIATVLVYAQAALDRLVRLRVLRRRDCRSTAFRIAVRRRRCVPRRHRAWRSIFLVAGFWSARRIVAASAGRARPPGRAGARWCRWSCLLSLWVAFGNLDRDLRLRRRRARAGRGIRRWRRGDRARAKSRR